MEAHLRLSAAHYPVLSFGTGSLVRLPGPTITQPNVYPFNSTSYDQMYRELESKDARLYRANGLLNMLERNRGVKRGPERWQDWRVGLPRLPPPPPPPATEAAAAAVTPVMAADRGSVGVEGGVVDVVVTCEERCWDAVIDDLHNRGAPLNRPVHVINVDIKDNHEEALVGGSAILDLAGALNRAALEERKLAGGDGDGDGVDGAVVAWERGVGPGRESFDERVPDIIAEWQGRWPHLPALWTLAWF